MGEAFAQIGDRTASTVNANSPHPLMHRTESVAYAVVMGGCNLLVLDDSELALKRGSLVIQRAANRAWATRSDEIRRMLFMLLSGRYELTVAAALSQPLHVKSV